MKKLLVRMSLNHPKLVIAATVLITIALGMQMPKIHVDTDPENMLPEDEAVRIYHEDVKDVFGLHDILVVGIVREEGVFRPETLERVATITEAIRDMDGVIDDDILAPTEVDDICVITAPGHHVRFRTNCNYLAVSYRHRFGGGVVVDNLDNDFA